MITTRHSSTSYIPCCLWYGELCLVPSSILSQSPIAYILDFDKIKHKLLSANGVEVLQGCRQSTDSTYCGSAGIAGVGGTLEAGCGEGTV